MNEDDLRSIDDIDNLLDEEYDIAESDADEVENDDENTIGDESESISEDTTEDTEATVNDEVEEDIPGEDVQPDQNSTEVNDSKPSADDKKSYAFENMRKENSSLRQEKAELEGYKEFISDLAASYGYTDINKFQTDLKAARIAKEAQEKGVDPTLYKENIENRARIAELERQRDEEIFMRKADKFKDSVDKASKEYNVSEEEIFNRLETAGYTVDNILDTPNPKLLIEGVLLDKIKENIRQEHIKDVERINKMSESKNGTDGSVTNTVTIESLLKEDLKAYKADNFL